MKRMCPKFTTRPVLSQGYTELRICWNLFVNCQQNSISPNPARNEYSPLHKWVMGHLERRCNGNIRSQSAVLLGLLHGNFSGPLIKPFSFATHAVDNLWSAQSPAQAHCSSTLSAQLFQTLLSHSWPFRQIRQYTYTNTFCALETEFILLSLIPS